MQNPLRILVLEDNPDDAELMVRELRQSGFAFIWERVQTEPAFLAALASQPDVILADVVLPSFSGLRAMQLVQAQGFDIPVILVSAQTGDELAVSAMQQGAADYLLKDRLGRLGLAVGNALRRTQLHQQKLAAERALADREQRYRALIENSQDGIGLLDAYLRPLYISPAYAHLLGYTTAEYLALTISKLVHPDEAAELQGEMRRLLDAPGAHSAHVFRFKHKDGGWRWLEGRAQNLLDVPGVEGIVTSYRDVTERRQADEALRVASARNRIVSELTADFALDLAVSVDGRPAIEWITPSFTELTGYTLADMQRLNWGELVHPDDLAPAEAYLAQLLAGQGGSYEVRFITKRGAQRWLRFSAQTMEADGRADRFYVAAQDITERKQAEAALRQQAEEFGALVETARDVSAAHDLPALLETLVGRAATLLRASGAGVYLFDAEHGDMVLTAAQGLEVPKGIRLKLGEGVAGQVALTRRSVNVLDYNAWPSRSPHYAGVPFAAMLGVPMQYQGELVGVVVVDEMQPSTRAFSEADERLLTLFTGLAAGAVRTSRLLEAQRQRLIEQEAFNRLSTALRAGQSLEDMLPRLLDETLAVVGASHGAVGLLQNGRLLLRARRGFFERLNADEWRTQPGIGEHVVATGQPYVTRDFATDPLTRPSVLPLVRPEWGGAVVPIRTGAGVTGVLYVSVPLPREIMPSEVRLLSTVAEMAGSALQRMQVLEQVQERAEQLAAVNALGRALAETLDRPHIYAQLCATTRRLLPELSTLMLYLVEPDQRHLRCAYADRAGQALEVGDQPLLPLDQAEAATPARVVTERQPHIETGRADPAAPTALYVPLLAKGQAIGLLLAESTRDGRFAAADAELLAGVANTAAVAIDNAGLFAETEQRLQYFEALHHIDMAISGSLDLGVTLMVLLDQARAKLRVDAAAVHLYTAAQQNFEYTVGRGFRTRQIEQSRVRLGEGSTGQAVLERRALRVNHLAALPPPRPRAEVVEAEGFQAYYALPLLAKGQVKGLLELFHRAPLAPDTEWLNFLDALASQAAIAVDNASLFDRLQRSNVELIQTYDATIEGWAHLLDRRDQADQGHTRRLAARAVDLARAQGVADESLGHLRRGALLHDVGLLALPDAIMGKPGPLDEAEWAQVRRHPHLAQELLHPIAFLRPALEIPFAHQERWNGSGYPRGISGEAIPLAARIFAVVDVWDALTSPRPWRAAGPPEQANAFLTAQAGVLFDPEVVEAFLKLSSGG